VTEPCFRLPPRSKRELRFSGF